MTIQHEERYVSFRGAKGIATHRDPRSGKYYVEFPYHTSLNGWFDPNELEFK